MIDEGDGVALRPLREPHDPPRVEGGEIAESKPVTGPTEESKRLALAVAAGADAKKGTDVVILDVSQFLGITDYFVICSASSRKHAQVVAEHCRDIAIQEDAFARPLEGVREGSAWVCGDFGDVVLHVFQEDARDYYDLESLWADCPRLELPPAPSPSAPAGVPAQET